MFCSKCGQQLKEGAIFCNNCGNRVQAEVATPEPAPTPVETPQPAQVVQNPTMPAVELVVNTAPPTAVTMLMYQPDVKDENWVGCLSFFDNAKMVYTKKYATFSGRATRGEYWRLFLFNSVIGAILSALSSLVTGATGASDFGAGIMSMLLFYIIGGIIGLAVFLPSLAVTVRRLHDIGKSGWFILVSLIPFIGYFILLYWLCKPTQFVVNAYGPVPDYTYYQK